MSENEKVFIINYTGANYHTITYPGSVIASKFVHGGEKIFSPANNEITQSEYEIIKDTPAFKHLLDAGRLKWVKGSPEDKDAKSVEISTMEVNSAKPIIEQTFDVDTLEKWKGREKRPQVIKMLETQIEKLTKVEEKKK